MQKKTGVVVCVQPWLEDSHYASAATFKQALAALLAQVERRSESTTAEADDEDACPMLVVFPEMVGTWLVAMDELPADFEGDSSAAMAVVVRRHLWSFVAHLLRSFVHDHFRFGLMAHVKRSLFRLKAHAMFNTYREVFSELAQEHEAWIVAGSILLPRVKYYTQVSEGLSAAATDDSYEMRRLETRLSSQGLYNVSLSFAPDGSVCNVTHKCHLDSNELEFVDCAPMSAVHSFSSPFGTVGVAICADSWYPKTYERLREMGADIVCVPAFVTPNSTWDAPWGGYSGRSRHFPADVNASHIGNYKESEAWSEYALQGRLHASGARLGVCSYLVGKLWEMTGSGESAIVSGDGRVLAKSAKGTESVLSYEVGLL